LQSSIFSTEINLPLGYTPDSNGTNEQNNIIKDLREKKNGTIQIGLVAAFRNWLQTIGCFVIHWITAFTVRGKK
jgi:hypothetical protein